MSLGPTWQQVRDILKRHDPYRQVCAAARYEEEAVELVRAIRSGSCPDVDWMDLKIATILYQWGLKTWWDGEYRRIAKEIFDLKWWEQP